MHKSKTLKRTVNIILLAALMLFAAADAMLIYSYFTAKNEVADGGDAGDTKERVFSGAGVERIFRQIKIKKGESLLSGLFSSCGDFDMSVNPLALDYSVSENWAVLPEKTDRSVDVFFVCPTSLQGDAEQFVIDLSDESQRQEFLNNVFYEKGIYEANANFYAPYYRQMTLNGYYESVSPDERENYLSQAYADVRQAFCTYLKEKNEGRYVILAGFSQGADMIKRLMLEDGFMLARNGRLVAAYVIGWNITDEDVAGFERNGVFMAKGETDTGTVIAFCSEDEAVESTVIVPEKTNGINPLNWKTDDEEAGTELHKGYCYPDTKGRIQEEWIHYAGAYRDLDRGTLKLTHIPKDSTEYNVPQLGFLNKGDYHAYDYMMFYRNLEENVQKRIAAFLDIPFDSFFIRQQSPDNVLDKTE